MRIRNFIHFLCIDFFLIIRNNEYITAQEHQYLYQAANNNNDNSNSKTPRDNRIIMEINKRKMRNDNNKAYIRGVRWYKDVAFRDY